ncbi:MAG: TIGR03790 family protein, partial [Minisyncoccota bacterium]
MISSPKPAYAGYYDYNDTILVINDNSATSTAIGNYFLAHRNFPARNVVHITCSTAEVVSRSEFTNNIRTPIENFLISNNLASTTNYIILTKDVPIETSDNGYSVDDQIALILGKYASYIGGNSLLSNPYWNANTPFSSATYGFYLVTHLEGYTVSDVENLIDRSSNATTTNNGTFVLNGTTDFSTGDGYGFINIAMANAASLLAAKGYSVTFATTSYLTYQHNVQGYYSWGSNDGRATTTNSIPHNTYMNGAIGDTAVSTSARTFTSPAVYGQSLIADWIAEGISGIQGYVSEPYTSALSHADTLFNRYTSGFTMADSFGMADPEIDWKNLIVGDPKMLIVKTPQAFNITSPANNSISATQSPTFVWGTPSAFYGISKYQLFIDGSLNTDNIASTSTSVVPAGTLSAGTHTWYIKAFDNNGDTATSTSTYTLNIIPGYTSPHTFYVDNVLGNDTSNVGSQAQPWATLAKAGITAQTGDTVIIVKNANNPYRETLSPSNNGVTFEGLDALHKPELWGSTDVSGGWSIYGGGNPNTYQKSVATQPNVVAEGPSISSLAKLTEATSTAALTPGEWYWSSGILYYCLQAGENITTIHIEASSLAYVVLGRNGATFQNLTVRYADSDGVILSGSSSNMQGVEVYNSATGLLVNANTEASSSTIANCIFANNNSDGVYLNVVAGVNLHNNLIYGNSIGLYVFLYAINSNIENNISSGNTTYALSGNGLYTDLSGFNSTYNNWDGTIDSANVYTSYGNLDDGTGDQLTPALFVSTSTNTFTLQPTSPNIDTGTNVGLTTDILGNPIYGTPDIGPYEYQPPSR